MNARFALLAAALLVPSVSSAADLPVSYLVEEKPLKAAVAGTPLAFELYSDSACTTLVQSVPVNVENVTVLSKLKQMTPKGGVKNPNTVELRTTLTNVIAGGSVFLKVTGLGVAPIEACQAQAGQINEATTIQSVTIQRRHPAYAKGWIILNSLPLGLEFPSFLVASSPSAANALNALAQDLRYTCDVGGSYDTVVPTLVGDYIPAFTVGNCVSLPPTCTDILKNQGESDVDCGGATACPRCANGKACTISSDCTSNNCSGTVCQP